MSDHLSIIDTMTLYVVCHAILMKHSYVIDV